MKRRVLLMGAGAVLTGCAGGLFGPREPALPASAAAKIPVLEVPGPAGGEDAEVGAKGQPYRFAEMAEVQASPESHGVWSSWDEQRLRWRLDIFSAGARSLNLHFGDFSLPASARLTIFNPENPAARAEFTTADRKPHGQLWTPQFIGERLRLDLVVNPDQRGDIRLELKTVNVGFR